MRRLLSSAALSSSLLSPPRLANVNVALPAPWMWCNSPRKRARMPHLHVVDFMPTANIATRAMSTGASIDDLKEVDDALTKVEAEIEEVQRRLKGPGLDEKTQDYLRKKKELLRKEKEQLRKELKEQRLVPGVRAPQEIPAPGSYRPKDLPERDSLRWAHLCSLNKLKECIGKVIELPLFPPHLLPKEFDQQIARHVLLTPERFKLVEEVFNTVHLGQVDVLNSSPYSGMILSGPYGVGKTVDSYLLMSVLFMNNALVIYIPKCREWVGRLHPEQYFVQRLLQLNAELMSALPVVSDTNYLGQSLYSLAAQSDTPACPLYDYIMIELGQVRQHPVAFVIDELNEVFEANKQDDNFFRDFTIMTGYLGGARTISILSGSAHSLFERTLQSAMQRWLRPVLPLSRAMFDIASFGPHAAIPLPAAVGKDLLAEITGGTPREMRRLHEYLQNRIADSAAVFEWVDARSTELLDELDGFVSTKLANPGDYSRFQLFLQWFISPAPHDAVPLPGVVWDSGLGYRSAKGIFTTTCIPAARALMMYYAHNDDSLPPLAAATTDHDKCGLFERHVVRAFMRGSLQLNCFPLGDPDVDLSLPFASTFYIKYFDQTAESFPNVTGRQVVYIPEAETYQGWDFLVHTPGTGDVAERLCFIQVMIQTPRDHDKSHFKIKKSFESSSPDRPSYVAKVVKQITGVECKTLCDDEGDLHCEPATGGKKLDVHFIVVTAASKANIVSEEANISNTAPNNNTAADKKRKGRPAKNPDEVKSRPAYRNLLIVSREHCEQQLRIVFPGGRWN